jgi:hypothetical protein
MKRHSQSVDTTASPERVWEVISDIDRWHEWTPSITSITRDANAAFAVGTWVTVRQPGFPPARWRISDIRPGWGFTWVSTAPGIRVVATHDVEATPGGSRATLAIEYHGALGAFFEWLTRAKTARYVEMEATGLRRRSEDPGYRHSGA